MSTIKNKKSTRHLSKKISLKSVNKLEKLYDEYSILDSKLNEKIEDPKHSNKELYKIMNNIEQIKKKIAINETSTYYPNIYNKSFSKDLFNQIDFNIYKIKNKEADVKKLLLEYKQINKVESKINKSLKSSKKKPKNKNNPLKNQLKNMIN